MPPPPKTEKSLGERRLTNFTGVGISVLPEIDVAGLTAGKKDDEEPEDAIARAMHADVCTEYKKLEAAVADNGATDEHFTQPWKN